MIELNIIKVLLNTNIYNKYYNYIYNNIYIDNIKTNNKYIYKLYITLKELKDNNTNTSIHSVDDLVNTFYTLYPATTGDDKDTFDGLFNQIRLSDATEDTSAALIERLRELFIGRELASHALDVAEARRPLKSLLERFEEITKEQPSTNESVIYTESLDDILEEAKQGGGISWPLNCLDLAIGPLNKGDFGWIFARPEVGKTAMLEHIVTNAVTQTTSPVIWINNEEATRNIYLRSYYSLLGITKKDLLNKSVHYKAEYERLGGNRIKFVDNAIIPKRDIERVVEELKPSLIVIDQLDKVHGFHFNDRYDLMMKAKYQWARELAKQYCPVIGTCQASASAEGKMWLDMDDADSSKTAKQGEADWIIGIGVRGEDGFENMRYLSVLKNKLGNGMNCQEALRHGKFRVELEHQYSRYKDTDYVTT